MKLIIPQNKNIVCKCIASKNKTTTAGFIYTSVDVPLYEVTSIADKAKNDIELEVGDVVVVNSTGTKIEVDGEEFYLFSSENIMAKIA